MVSIYTDFATKQNAANYVSSVQQSSFSKPHQGGLDNIVLVKNLTGRTYPQFAALGLSDMILKPVNVDEFKNRFPVFAGVQITTANKTLPFAILLEPLQANEIGKAMVLGVVQMQIFINKEKDQFAIPKPDSYSGEMHSSDSGVVRILWKAGVSGLQWCVLQLGGAGSGNAGPPAYNGFFTLKDVSTAMILMLSPEFLFLQKTVQLHLQDQHYLKMYYQICGNNISADFSNHL